MNVKKNNMPFAIAVLLFSSTFVATGSTGTNEPLNTATQTSTNAIDLVTKNGAKYRNATILRVEADALVVQHAGGLARVLFNEVSDTLQKQYGYDPVKAADTKRQQAEAEAARRVAEQAPLEGQDLVAWKLARQAAETKCKELSTPHRITASHQTPTQGSAAAYAIEFNAKMATEHPTYAVVAEPQRKFMAKSDTGDWTFIIPVKESWYYVERKTWVPTWKRLFVKVTNYGTEIRVEGVRLDPK